MPAQKTAQETQQMVGWGTSIANFFVKYVDFEGKSTRSEYWFAYLTLLLVEIPFIILSTVFPEINNVILVMGILVFIPYLSLSVRRFRDAGIPAALFFILNPLWPSLFIALIANSLMHGEIAPMVGSGWIAFIAGLLIDFVIFQFIVACLPSRRK